MLCFSSLSFGRWFPMYRSISSKKSCPWSANLAEESYDFEKIPGPQFAETAFYKPPFGFLWVFLKVISDNEKVFFWRGEGLSKVKVFWGEKFLRVLLRLHKNNSNSRLNLRRKIHSRLFFALEDPKERPNVINLNKLGKFCQLRPWAVCLCWAGRRPPKLCMLGRLAVLKTLEIKRTILTHIFCRDPLDPHLSGFRNPKRKTPLFFERKWPKRKPWHRGKSSKSAKKRSRCVFWAPAFYHARPYTS